MAYDVDKVIKVAEAEVGYLEKESNKNLNSKTANAGDENYTKYANDFDTKYPNFYNGKKNGYAWCDMFLDWCFVKAYGEADALKLLGQPKKSCGAGCEFSANYYKKMDAFYKYPKVGDQIFFYTTGTKIGHTGLVYKVDKTYVYTIEGNTSSASGVVANGGCVAKKKYKLTYLKIAGYGRPKYGTKTTAKTETKTEAKTDKKTTTTKTPATPKVTYFKKYTGNSSSLVDALKAVGATSTYAYRKKIATANSMKAYVGTAKQNTTMLELLKKGKLIKP